MKNVLMKLIQYKKCTTMPLYYAFGNWNSEMRLSKGKEKK